MMFRLFCRSLFIASLTLTNLSAHAVAADGAAVRSGGQVAQDIAAAGRLRMQPQRLAKLYQQVGQGINAGQAATMLDRYAREFDGDFARLARQGRRAEVQKTLARTETAWQEMRGLLKKQPDAATGERVNQLADELMVHAGKLALQIEAESDTAVGRLIDLSSRLNMLSQRLARLTLQAYAGDRSRGVMIDIDQARKEFVTGLNELDAARENSAASRDAIALAKNQWIFFNSAIDDLGRAGKDGGKSALNVATSSERIAQVLDESSQQYARDYVEGQRR